MTELRSLDADPYTEPDSDSDAYVTNVELAAELFESGESLGEGAEPIEVATDAATGRLPSHLLPPLVEEPRPPLVNQAQPSAVEQPQPVILEQPRRPAVEQARPLIAEQPLIVDPPRPLIVDQPTASVSPQRPSPNADVLAAHAAPILWQPGGMRPGQLASPTPSHAPGAASNQDSGAISATTRGIADAPPLVDAARRRKLLLIAGAVGSVAVVVVVILLVAKLTGGKQHVTPTAPAKKSTGLPAARVTPARTEPPEPVVVAAAPETPARPRVATKPEVASTRGGATKPPVKRTAPGPAARRIRGKKVVLEYDGAAVAATPSLAAQKDEDPAIVRARSAYASGNQRLFAGDAAGAVSAYKQSLSLYPGYVGGYRGLGLAYAQLGDKVNALKALKAYVASVPDAKDVPLIKKRIARLQPP